MKQTCSSCCARPRVLGLEVDASLARVELDLGNVPGRLQAKCGGEEGFDLRAHGVQSQCQGRAVVPPVLMFSVESISTTNDIEPKKPTLAIQSLARKRSAVMVTARQLPHL